MRLMPLGLAALLLIPAFATAAPQPEFPEELTTLLATWVAEQEALLTEEDRAATWFHEPETFLARAKAAQAQGRVREGMFHLETFHELLITKRLMDEAERTFPSDGERRAFALQRLRALHSDGDRAWAAFREKMHGYDDQLHSLRTVELALYSADMAVGAQAGAQGFRFVADDLAKRTDFPEGHLLALTRASATTILAIGWADDVLDEATRSEGLPPKIVESGWTNVTNEALNSGYDNTPPDLEVYETLADPVRANREKLMSVAFYLASLRQGRISEMNTVFGDGGQRNDDVLNTSKVFMARHYNNTTLEDARDHGLLGVFTSDAIDRAALTLRYLDEGKGSIEFVYAAWASLDHAGYANVALAQMSPIAPPPATEKTPGLGLLAIVALLGLVAIARRR